MRLLTFSDCFIPGSVSIEDIEVLEGSGNLVVNKIFEATLEPDDFDKYFVAPTADMECRRRSRFIKHKYKRRLFFDDMLYHECILSLLQKNRRRCCSQLGPSSNEPVCYNLSCQRESLRGQLSYQESEDRFANGNSLRESQQSYATSTDEESFDLARDIPSFVHIYEGPENESTIPEDGLAEPCLVPTNVELEYEDIDKRMGPGGVLTYEELASESTTEELAPEDAAQEPTSYYASPRVPALEEYQGPDSGQKIEQRRQLPENKCLIEYSLSRDLDISQNCVGDSVLRIEVNRFEKRDLRSEIGTRAAFGPPQA